MADRGWGAAFSGPPEETTEEWMERMIASGAAVRFNLPIPRPAEEAEEEDEEDG